MIYITGDTHGMKDIQKLAAGSFDSKNFTKEDYVIICGDFGLVWNNHTAKSDSWWLQWLEEKPFTTLFVDGNHENHDILDNMPIEIWNGGKVHKVRPSVIHLTRGQIFELEDRTFFTFGGADSVDKLYRKEFISWWKREMPSNREYEEGLENLSKYNNQVDYIITHTCPSSVLMKNRLSSIKNPTSIEKYFDVLLDRINMRHWYFGHFHMDLQLNNKFTVLYNEIIRIK